MDLAGYQAEYNSDHNELIRERDFLADQVSKLETVIDEKQDTIDRLIIENARLKAALQSERLKG